MGNLKSYSKDNTPKLNNAPVGNYYYKNALAYKPVSTEEIGTIVISTLNKLLKELKTDLDSFNKLIEDMSDSFGTKFISINGKELGIVDKDSFKKLANDLSDSLADSVESSEQFFKICNTEIESITKWLVELQRNYNAFKLAQDRYNNFDNSEDLIEFKREDNSDGTVDYEDRLKRLTSYNNQDFYYYQETLKKLTEEMNQFKELVGEPTDYGKWIKA